MYTTIFFDTQCTYIGPLAQLVSHWAWCLRAYKRISVYSHISVLIWKDKCQIRKPLAHLWKVSTWFPVRNQVCKRPLDIYYFMYQYVYTSVHSYVHVGLHAFKYYQRTTAKKNFVTERWTQKQNLIWIFFKDAISLKIARSNSFCRAAPRSSSRPTHAACWTIPV